MTLSIDELQERISAAAASFGGKPLEPVSGGTKRGYGRRVEAAQPLDVGSLTGIVDYLPQELICVVRPGTPLAELEALLAERRQMLAFEPPLWAPTATIGGVVACNLSGPRRFKAGAARDHLLGFQAITGRGELIRGGGRVVKNVTGYDLSKLMCGSFGTLVVFTELCLKVLPRPEAERTVAVTGLSERAALLLVGEAARTQQEPSGLAYLPPGSAFPRALDQSDTGTALIRVEGPESAVTSQAQALARVAQDRNGRPEILGTEASRAAWLAVRELAVLPVGPNERVWRCSIPGAAAPDLAETLRKKMGPTGARLLFDWAGALVWAALSPAGDPWIHEVVRSAGGHARLLRSAAPVSPDLDAFAPLDAVQRNLHEQLKLAFDPARILNPGRMYAGL